MNQEPLRASNVVNPKKSRTNGITKSFIIREFVTQKNILSLLSRCFLSAIFVYSSSGRILQSIGNQQYMNDQALSLTGLFLLSIAFLELLAGISLLLGYKVRYCAMILVTFLIPATLIFHSNFSDQMQVIQFMKNLAIMGGLLMVIQNGSGGFSLERGQ